MHVSIVHRNALTQHSVISIQFEIWSGTGQKAGLRSRLIFGMQLNVMNAFFESLFRLVSDNKATEVIDVACCRYLPKPASFLQKTSALPFDPSPGMLRLECQALSFVRR